MPLDIFYLLYVRVTTLPFLQIPPGFTYRKNRLALDHSEFVNEAVSVELLHTNRVMELNGPPHVVSPFESVHPAER